MAPETDPAFEALLDYLRDNRGFDFTGYKRGSLVRRVRKRMQEVGIADFSEYLDYLEVHPEEFTHLFNTILINVTSFFRDPPTWEVLANEIVPRIVDGTSASEHIRVWSVGCASGEEAYTVAMILAEAVGESSMIARVKIYATDVDEEALATARAGIYSQEAVQAIPDGLRDTYLEPVNGAFAFKKDLRRAVIFGRHDLVQDAPISRVDLIVCRNTLMYFNAEVQSKIYNGFHFALKPNGYLVLGKSELLLTRTSIFMPVDVKRRVFARVGDVEERAGVRRPRTPAAAGEDLLRAKVFESAAVAQVVLDAAGTLVDANSRARSQFSLGEPDLGKALQEFELSYRPIELRSRIEQAASDRRSRHEPAVPWEHGGDRWYLDIEIVPVFANDELLGTSITFTDVSRAYKLQEELERSRLELETAYEEIQSTVEELETTNEELQSTNEELETTNEELQSTNEELETMNEELQSTNEELETINTELTERTYELNRSNAFLESILASLSVGVVVLDDDLSIRSWNDVSEDMWGLRADEVHGRNLFGLDIGLPVADLQGILRDCLSGRADYTEVTVDATNRRGKSIRCKVICSVMKDPEHDRKGAILLLDEVAEEGATTD